MKFFAWLSGIAVAVTLCACGLTDGEMDPTPSPSPSPAPVASTAKKTRPRFPPFKTKDLEPASREQAPTIAGDKTFGVSTFTSVRSVREGAGSVGATLDWPNAGKTLI